VKDVRISPEGKGHIPLKGSDVERVLKAYLLEGGRKSGKMIGGGTADIISYGRSSNRIPLFFGTTPRRPGGKTPGCNIRGRRLATPGKNSVIKNIELFFIQKSSRQYLNSVRTASAQHLVGKELGEVGNL